MISHLRLWGAAYLVLAVGLVVTTFSALRHHNALEFQNRVYFIQVSDELHEALQDRVNAYLNAMIGIRALFRASVEVDPDEFRTYLQATGLMQRHPGFRLVGFAERVPTEQLTDFAERLRTETGASGSMLVLDVAPSARTDDSHYLIKYVAPADQHRFLLGTDLCGDRDIRNICIQAADSGEATRTRWIDVASGSGAAQRGSLLLLPVYRNGWKTDTAADRRRALQGFIFAEFVVTELLDAVYEENVRKAVQVEIFDPSDLPADRVLFDDDDHFTPEQFPNTLAGSYATRLGLAGADWYVLFSPRKDFPYPLGHESVWWIALGGTLITLLLSYVSLIQARTILERKRQADALERQVVHDSLTGLPNRIYLYRELDASRLARAPRPDSFALCLVDLNGFKEINDTLGHQAGDAILRQLGPRLHQFLSNEETVVRLGGDEFAVVDFAARDAPAAEHCARRILAALQEPFEIKGIKVRIGASIGIARYPEHGRDAGELLRCADVAMYSAKERRTGFVIYDPELDPHTPRRLALMTELEEAIQMDRLTLHYQPIVHLASGAVAAVEALLRWNHPRYGTVPPDEFIPEAEKHDLIKPLSLWVLDQALAQARHWRDAGLPVPVAVNMSARNIQDCSLPGQVAELLQKHKISAKFLEIELTETALMQDSERSFDVLQQLSELGLRVAVDDFGTGYSSLAYLKTLPVTTIKIDRSFVMDMEHDENDAVIVRAVVDLAHNIGRTVVAEGIENENILQLLKILRCDYAQGYFIARPMPAEHTTAWLKARHILPVRRGSKHAAGSPAPA